jgi:cyclopropane fatty-acyl-phospholipid synthase-like methyltransferase
MSYASLTVDSPSRLKRFSHRRRFDLAIELLELAAGQRVLDYGSGDGYFVRQAVRQVPEAEYWAYDPHPGFFRHLQGLFAGTPLHAVQHTADLADASFDGIACCEVFEHLPPEGQQHVLADLVRLVRPGGRIVVSVPIEIGPPALLKNAVRWLSGQTHEGIGPSSVLRSVLGLPVARHVESGYISSHLGFDFRELERHLRASGLLCARKTFSPLPRLPGICNSQVFYLLRKLT